MEMQNQFLVTFSVLGIVFLIVMYHIYWRQPKRQSLVDENEGTVTFIWLAGLAMVIRVLLAYQMPGYTADMNCFRSWAHNAWTGGLPNFYSGEFFADYPPLYVYVLSLLGGVGEAAHMDISSAGFGLLIKLPALVMDIVLAAMVFFMMKKETNGKAALALSALILFNPAVMVNSAVWGQVDVIATVMMVLTIYMLYKEKYIWSAVLFILAFLLKPQAIMISPVLLFVFIRNIAVAKEPGQRKKALLTLLGAVGVMAALFFLIPLPFAANKEPLWLVDLVVKTMGQYPQATLNAFNVYALAGLNFQPAADIVLLGLPLNIWGFIFIAAVCAYALWLFLKKPAGGFLFALAALIVLGVFTFAHGMHDRYLYVVPVLLLFAFIFEKDKRLLASSLLLFGVSLLNQSVSLYYYEQWVPEALTIPLSLACIVATIYTFYTCTKIALGEKQPFSEPEKPAQNPAGLRLQNFRAEKRLDRKDAVLMVVIAGIYACVAFTNLGAATIPETSVTMREGVVIQFAQQEQVAGFMYYEESGSGEFEMSASPDGQDYSPVELTPAGTAAPETQVTEDGATQGWRSFAADFTAQFVRIDVLDGEIYVPEMAFINNEGQLIQPVRVTVGGEDASYLFNEQDLVPLDFAAADTVVVPQSGGVLQGAVNIEFAQSTYITEFKYYADYGAGSFSMYVSEDGETYMPVGLREDGDSEASAVRQHEKGNMYRWWSFPMGVDAKYVRVEMTNGSLPVLEMAFYDGTGRLVEPASAKIGDKDASYLFDEQDQVPRESTYMTDFYFDELYHVRTAYENIHNLTVYEITHPPLGKIIIASGIEMFGMNPFGWRFMGTLTGVLMLPVIYALAKQLTRNRKFAIFASVLMAADFMHFAQTRIGTIDSYSILWIMLMYLFMYKYSQTNFNAQGLKPTLIPLALCGLFFGLGAATKWLCLYAAPGLLIIFLIMMYRRYKEYRYAKESGEYPDVVQNYNRNLGMTLVWCVVFFILVPVVIYLLSYIPYFLVKDGGAYTSLQDIINNQKYMLNYHSTLDPEYVHPFSSTWYSWPADIRPVLFFREANTAANTTATLSTMGNPLIWWTGVVAVISLLVMAAKKPKRRKFELLFLGIAALSNFVVWMFISREVYIYHYFAVVPFLILLIVFWLKYLEEDYKYGKLFGYIFVAACVAFFVFFYPVITGVPANTDYINGLRWLETWPFY